jgi:hypothetical protein
MVRATAVLSDTAFSGWGVQEPANRARLVWWHSSHHSELFTMNNGTGI